MAQYCLHGRLSTSQNPSTRFPRVKTETKNMKGVWRSLRVGRVVAASALSAAVVLSACGSDDNNSTASSSDSPKISCTSGSINGAGSTFVQPIVQQWVKDYTAACSGATINYQGVGSGAGVTQFNSGSVQFAASDVPLSSSEQTAADAKYPGGVATVPWAAGAVALEYKLTGVEEVHLSAATIAGIFAGAIKTWNDPAIAGDNQGRLMPSTPIQVMHRSDGSGTTAVLTQYLTATAPDVWKAGAGKAIDNWPTGQGLKGSDGVTASVKQTEGAIGYAELSFAKNNALQTVKVKNESGKYIAADAADGVSAALAEATVDNDAKVTLNFKPQNAAAYPLSTFSYLIMPKGSDASAKLLQSFTTYAVTDGQKSAAPLSYVALPDSVVTKVKDKVASLGSAS
jgi:phosphate transport system substrate-binding protein